MGRTAKRVRVTREDVEEDRRFVTALARGLDVLRCFGPEERWLPNQEIARRTGLPKATVSRITFTLTSLGYLDHSPEREMYAVGLPVVGLGFRVLTHFDIGRAARPFMQGLADQVRGAVSLGVRHGTEVIYVAHCRSASPLTLGLDVGARLPLAQSAMGRAVIFGLEASVREQVLECVRKSSPENAWDGLREELAEAAADFARRGFVTTAPEAEIGVVAVPLHIGDGREPLALNCGGPASAFSQDRLLKEVGPLLVRAARSVGATLCSEK